MKDNTKNILKIFIPIGVVFGAIALCSLWINTLGENGAEGDVDEANHWANRETEAIEVTQNYVPEGGTWTVLENIKAVLFMIALELGAEDVEIIGWSATHTSDSFYTVEFVSRQISTDEVAIFRFTTNLATGEVRPLNDLSCSLWQAKD